MNSDAPWISNLIEPQYDTRPRYWQVYFGDLQPECHWLVVDGERLYFDRDGTGDLSAPANLVCLSDRPSPETRRFRVGDVSEKGQLTAHRKLVLFADRTGGISLRIALNWGPIQGAYSIGSLHPETAPKIFLNGPLRLATIQNLDEFVCATRVENNCIEIRVTAVVGTPSSCGLKISHITYDPFPEELYPVAEIQFLDDSMMPFGEPLIVRLTSRSCGCQFFAAIESKWIRTNRAKVRLAFDRPTPIPVAPFEFHTRIDLHRIVDDSCIL